MPKTIAKMAGVSKKPWIISVTGIAPGLPDGPRKASIFGMRAAATNPCARAISPITLPHVAGDEEDVRLREARDAFDARRRRDEREDRGVEELGDGRGADEPGKEPHDARAVRRGGERAEKAAEREDQAEQDAGEDGDEETEEDWIH